MTRNLSSDSDAAEGSVSRSDAVLLKLKIPVPRTRSCLFISMEPSSSELATDLAAYLAADSADSIAVDYLVSAYSLEVESSLSSGFTLI